MSSATVQPQPSAPTTFTAAWDYAKTKCLDGLSFEDKQLFEFTTADDARLAITDAQNLYDKDHKHGKVWKCVDALVAGLETYGQAMDVFVNTTPLFLAPIWGTVRVFMQATRNFDNYVVKTLDIFGEIGDNLSRFQIYGNIFPLEAGVQTALVKVYVEILQFCISARHVFMLKGPQKHRLILRPFRDHAFKAMWQPFEVQFKTTLGNFKKHRMLLEDEVRAASAKAATSHYDRSNQEYLQNRDSRLRQDLVDQASRRRRLFSWLNATPKNQDAYNASKRLRHHGTCQWLLQHQMFSDWLANSHFSINTGEILWITGIPGRGKTVLCSCLIDHLKPSANLAGLAYFFCSRTDQDLSTSSHLSRALVSQFLASEKKQGDIFEAVQREYDQSEADVASKFQAWSLLHEISQLQTVYVIVDGFDECLDQDNLLAELKALGRKAKLIVFSRAMSSVWPKEFTSYTMSIQDRDVAADIAAMVRNRLDSSPIMSVLDPIVRANLERSLIKKADGMFLWIRLVLDQLDDLATFKEVRDHIDRTPTSVSAIYRVILEGFSKLPAIQQARTMKVLRWAVASRRPLSIREISDAIVLRASSSKIVDEDRILQIDRVLHQCDPLLHVNPDTKTVHLCHYSLKEFLFQLTNVEAQQFHLLESDNAEIRAAMSEELGKLSLRYLALEDLPDDWDCINDAQILDRFPLLRYAADHWLEHVLEAPATTANISLVNDFLRTSAAANWLRNFVKLRKQQFGRNNAGSSLVSLQADLSRWMSASKQESPTDVGNSDIFGDLLMKQYLSLQNQHGPKSPATLETGYDLCEHHSWMGRTHLAEELLESFLKGRPHPDTKNASHPNNLLLPQWLDLSRQKMMNGKLEDAETLSRAVFEVRKKALGPHSFETCEAAALLADICTDLGKLAEAEQVHQIALDGLMQARGDLDLDTLREFNNFGNTLKLMGKLEEAEKMLHKAYEGRKKVYGIRSQSTLRALDNLGTVYLDRGKMKESRSAHEQVVEGMKELLGDDEVYTLRAKMNLAAALARAGAEEEEMAIKVGIEAVVGLEKVFESEHIDTLRAAMVAGTVIMKRGGEWEEIGDKVLRKTMDGAKRTLGKDHFVVFGCEKALAGAGRPEKNGKDVGVIRESFREILQKSDSVHRQTNLAVKVVRVMIMLVIALLLAMVGGWLLDLRSLRLIQRISHVDIASTEVPIQNRGQSDTAIE